MSRLPDLLRDVRDCRLCEEHLVDGVRPILQADARARILIASQAPGRRAHASGIPFDDPSGDRLREWLGVSDEAFYDPRRFAIVPMAFCFPGSGRSGDLAPRPECAAAWRAAVLQRLPSLRLTLAIGRFAIRWHLRARLADGGRSLTEAVRSWRDHLPEVMPMPHPSPRNNVWLARNPWFEAEALPWLRGRVAQLVQGGAWRER